MTPRPPIDDDALSPEERALSARLSALDAGGPSAALDARILSAARAAVSGHGAAGVGTAGVAPSRASSSASDAASTRDPRRPASGHSPAPASRRRTRRWPTAVGAAATLVIAVGLAWQLKPLIDMPPPLRRQADEAASAETEVLAHAEVVVGAAPPPPAAMESATDAAAAASAPAPRRAVASRAPAPQRAPARVAKAAPEIPAPAAPASPADYMDEAVGHHADAVVATDAAAAPAAAPATAEPRSALHLSEPPGAGSDTLDRVTTTGSRIRNAQAREAARVERATVAQTFPPVAADAALEPLDWLQRVRERRDAGAIDDARASLRRFVREHPRHRLPDDLRALLAAKP